MVGGDTAPTNGKKTEVGGFVMEVYIEKLRQDAAKLETAAQERYKEHLVLLGKAQAFRELIAYHEAKEAQ